MASALVNAIVAVQLRTSQDVVAMPNRQHPPECIALVTGGARRVGEAIIVELVLAGYAVVIHAWRSKNQTEQLCREIIENGGRAGVVLGDLADHSTVIRLVPEASALLGPLTLLVNNANEFAYDEVASSIAADSIASLQLGYEPRCSLPKLLPPWSRRAAMHRLSISLISASTGNYPVSFHMD